MNAAAVAILALVAFVCAMLFAVALIRAYASKREASACVTFVSVCSIVITLFGLLLIPIDVYVVSSDLNADGTHADVELVERTQVAIKALYYVFYSLLFCWAFVVLPFAYFYYEEKDDEAAEEEEAEAEEAVRAAHAAQAAAAKRAQAAARRSANQRRRALNGDDEDDDDEDDDDDDDDGGAMPSRLRRRICAATKYTSGFVLFFAIVIVCGLLVRQGARSSDESWEHRVKADLAASDTLFAFTLGVLSVLGLFPFIVYAASGMSRLPVVLLLRAVTSKSSRTAAAAAAAAAASASPSSAPSSAMIDPELGTIRVGTTTTSSTSTSRSQALADADLNARLARTEESIAELHAQYAASGRQWSRVDRRRLADLQQESERLSQQRAARDREVAALHHVRAATKRERLSVRLWNAARPVRVVVGVLILLVALLLLVSLLMTIVDRLVHSACGVSCGYALEEPAVVNPLDEFFRLLAPYFPVDAIMFGSLIMYLYLCVMSGLVALGVRFLVWRMYTIRRGRTQPHALILACFLLLLVAVVLTFEVITLAPQYTAFGGQFYVPANATSDAHKGDARAGADDHASAAANVSSLSSSPSSPSSSSQPLSFLSSLVLPLLRDDSGNGTAIAKSACTLNVSIAASSSSSSSSSSSGSSAADYCRLSAIGSLVSTMAVEFPFFPVILLFGNFLFVLSFFVFVVGGLLRRKQVFGGGGGSQRLLADGDEDEDDDSDIDEDD